MPSRGSAVVVGSGPNGLAAAIVLAREGLEVVVHEAAERIGGGLRTEELTLPGFRHDVCSAIHPLARVSPLFRELDVQWTHSPAVLAHPHDDGCDLVWRSLARTRHTRAVFAGCCAHSGQPIERLAGRGVGVVLLGLAHTVGWPFPRGGAQALADALAARLRELGGEIRTSSRLEEPPEADLVLCDTPPAFVGRSVRYGPGAFKLDWALDGPIPWRDERAALAATVHLGGSAEEIAASERAPGSGRPFVILAQPSLWDETRAPAGQHTAWAYCHVPNGSDRDMSEAVEAQVERFAPGFRERILARSALAPRDLEEHDPNLVGGDVNGGAMAVRRLFAPGYRTERRGVYLCSASTPPGGGVHGLCGHVAARLALRDLGPTGHVKVSDTGHARKGRRPRPDSTDQVSVRRFLRARRC
ncbi:MAG TPA: NAD(P)/FAD-dependent oxidoreductase [Gaiellaceae bacterium]|jgi:phytoene dehydrogenase-like protein|nr:NAD(P)/FAD-dependent oxidoreductase [Gaiellaceae bacterium]